MKHLLQFNSKCVIGTVKLFMGTSGTKQLNHSTIKLVGLTAVLMQNTCILNSRGLEVLVFIVHFA